MGERAGEEGKERRRGRRRGEDPFPREMHSGWCPLASPRIMRGQLIVMQINSDDNTLSWTTGRLRAVSHRASLPMRTRGRPTIFH